MVPERCHYVQKCQKSYAQDRFLCEKNKRTVSNSRTGWEIYRKLINAQCLISKHRTDFFWKINKRTCAFIRQARVLNNKFCFAG